MIRAVLFDLDDTLVDHTTAAGDAVVAWAAGAGLDEAPDQLRERWASVSDFHYSRYRRREVTFEVQRRDRMREFLDRDLDDETADAVFADYLTRYEANWRTFADARPALERAVARGFVVAVLTNGNRRHQAHKMRSVGLDELGLRMFVSEDFPAGKPDPRAFLGTCAALEVQPEETLMVGDSPAHDVEGALGAGLDAVLLDRRDAHPEHPGRRIRTLDELWARDPARLRC